MRMQDQLLRFECCITVLPRASRQATRKIQQTNPIVFHQGKQAQLRILSKDLRSDPITSLLQETDMLKDQIEPLKKNWAIAL